MQLFQQCQGLPTYLGSKLMSSDGVYFVPSFTGMGAPHWDMYARGAVYGLTRGTTREHIIRAALEGIAFQSMDVINAMSADTGNDISTIKVDGGASASCPIMQFQADITGKEAYKACNSGNNRPRRGLFGRARRWILEG